MPWRRNVIQSSPSFFFCTLWYSMVRTMRCAAKLGHKCESITNKISLRNVLWINQQCVPTFSLHRGLSTLLLTIFALRKPTKISTTKINHTVSEYLINIMGCRFSQLNPDLNIYAVYQFESTSTLVGVDSANNLVFQPFPISSHSRPFADFGDTVFFACGRGKRLALDGQILHKTAYSYVCPSDLGPADDWVDVDIGGRLSCVWTEYTITLSGISAIFTAEYCQVF